MFKFALVFTETTKTSTTVQFASRHIYINCITSISSFRPLYIYTYLHLMCIIQYKTLYKNYKNTITHKVSGEYSLEEDGFNQAQNNNNNIFCRFGISSKIMNTVRLNVCQKS